MENGNGLNCKGSAKEPKHNAATKRAANRRNDRKKRDMRNSIRLGIPYSKLRLDRWKRERQAEAVRLPNPPADPCHLFDFSKAQEGSADSAKLASASASDVARGNDQSGCFHHVATSSNYGFQPPHFPSHQWNAGFTQNRFPTAVIAPNQYCLNFYPHWSVLQPASWSTDFSTVHPDSTVLPHSTISALQSVTASTVAGPSAVNCGHLSSRPVAGDRTPLRDEKYSDEESNV